MIRVGFVLLSHTHPEQILGLTRVLTELYDAPPIVCHHDFDQAPLVKSEFPSNVRFVEPHLPTFWGCFSIVPAALAAIKLLMRGANSPDWFYLLSGSDYPTLAPEKVISFLASTDANVFIDHREIQYQNHVQPQTDQTGFHRPSYNSLAYKRYCAVAVPRPSLAKPLSFPPVGRVYLRHPTWRSVFPTPFGPGLRCFAGEHWFTANARAAEVLLTETAQSRRLFQHLRTRECPEECYYHTVLGNAPLKLWNNNLRFIEWPSSDAWHPKTLEVSDLPAIEESHAHFGRKVDYNSDLMHELNRRLGVGQPALR